jgi:outer membrane PBP1 activator LpoA protein
MLIKTIKIQAFLISTFFLCQCTPAINSSELTPPALKPKVENKLTSPYSQASSKYLTQANTQEGNEKQKSLLSAAGRLLDEGQWRQSAAILTQTSDGIPALADEKNLLLAQIALIRGQPHSVLNQLAQIKAPEDLPPYQKVGFHELLAQTYRSLDKPLESIEQRIQLDSLLVNESSQQANRRTLWLTLMHLPQEELTALASKTKDHSTENGWLQLALISRTYRDNPKALLAALDQWQTEFNTHPALHFLPNPLNSVANKIHPQPKHIALLLPLSGALEGPGGAVRDGFMAAYNKAQKPMQIKMYDTNKESVASLYQRALDEGADYVVGPLTKSEVAEVAALPHPVPTLLLNDSNASVQENSYLFGLSPINEAIEVAIRAKNKGYRRALIIGPSNAWGNEVINAFREEWQKNGSQITDTFLYGAKEDLNKKMHEFLKITESQKREKQLKELLGYKIQSMISRRQDFDMIFMLAYPSKARQIMPLLNYYYAGDVPVYATASVYGGSANPLKDKDLDGIIFCDIPWVFSNQVGIRNWPEQFNSYNRLYALGMDSYTLTTQLNQLIVFSADKSDNGEGILYLKPSQHVARVLEWGQFKQGLVHSLGEAV